MTVTFWIHRDDVETLAYQIEHFDNDKEPLKLSSFYVNRQHVEVQIPYSQFIQLKNLNLIIFR